MPIEQINHTADIAVRVFAPSMEDLIRECIRSVQYLCRCEVEENAVLTVTYEIKENVEDSIFDMLNDVIYHLDVENILPSTIDVQGNSVKVFYGKFKGKPALELKALTYHRLEVKKNNDVFETFLVFDV